MDAKTLAALRGSIAKWEAIVAGPGTDQGPNNCPLCQLFRHQNCNGCPVKQVTGKEDCKDTPYTEWSDFFFVEMYYAEEQIEEMSPDAISLEYRDRAIALAQAELDFLKSLLPTEPSNAA